MGKLVKLIRNESVVKVLQTIGSLNAGAGGTSTCAYELVSAMNSAGYHVELLTLRPASPAEKMLGEDEFIHALTYDARTPLALSLNFRQSLAKSNYALYHTNGLWMDVNHATCAHARKVGMPYIISPHGMLYPQALAISSWKKKLMLTFGHKRDLQQATCIHVTCKQEMEHCRAFGLKQPIAVIPNPVQIPSYLNELSKRKDGIFRVGFLGRFHPIKNIESIIRAWAALKFDNAELLLYGDGEPDYVASLKTLVCSTKAPNVRFMGFVNGREKYDALARLNLLCAPSHQENFGMSIAEALLAGTPVIASTGTPWEALNTNNCGWWRDNSVESLCECIQEAQFLSPSELRAMGERGKQLILSSYSSAKVSQMMYQLYGWVLGKQEKPDFVFV